MLYQNPELKQLHRFAAWARERGHETFDYASHTFCAVCQFTERPTSEWENNEMLLNAFASEAYYTANRELGWKRDRVPFSYLVVAIERRIMEVGQ